MTNHILWVNKLCGHLDRQPASSLKAGLDTPNRCHSCGGWTPEMTGNTQRLKWSMDLA